MPYKSLSEQKTSQKSTYVPLRDRPEEERNPLLEAVKKAEAEQKQIAETKVAEQKKNIFQKAGEKISSFFGQAEEKRLANREKIKEAGKQVLETAKYFPESLLETIGIKPENIDQILKIEPRVGNLGLGVPPKPESGQKFLNYDPEALKKVKVQQWVDNDLYADPTITWKDVNETVPITVGQIISKIPYVAIEGMNRFMEGAGAAPVRLGLALLDVVDPGGKIAEKYIPEKIDPLIVSILKLTGHDDWIQYLPEEQKRQLRIGRSAGVEMDRCMDAGGDLYVCFAMSFGSALMDVAIVADVVTSGVKFARDVRGFRTPAEILKGGDIFKMAEPLTEAQFLKYKKDIGLPDNYTMKNFETDMINAKDFGQPNAKPNTLGDTYRKQAHIYHPDNPLTGDATKMVKINAAYKGLTGYDPTSQNFIQKLANELTKERPLWDKAVDDAISGKAPEVQKQLKAPEAPAPPEKRVIAPERTFSNAEIQLKEKGFESLQKQIAMDAEKRGFPDIAKNMMAVDVSGSQNVQEVFETVMEKSGELSGDSSFRGVALNRMASQQAWMQEALNIKSDLVTTEFKHHAVLQIKSQYPEVAGKINALDLRKMSLPEAYNEVRNAIPLEFQDNEFINYTLDGHYRMTLTHIEGVIFPGGIVVEGEIIPKSTFTYRHHNWVIVDVLDDGTVKATPFDPVIAPLDEISVKELQNRTAEELKEVFNVVKQEGKKVLQKSAEPLMNIPTENIVETYPITGLPPAGIGIAPQPTGITPVKPEVVIPTIYKTLLPEQKLLYQKVYDAGIAKGLKPLEAGQKAIDVAVKPPQKPVVIPVSGKVVPEVPIVIAKTTQLTTESQVQAADLEKQLQDAYSKDAQAFVQAIQSIKQEVSGTGLSKASWIPEDLRSKDLIDKAIQGLTAQGISFPGDEAKQTELLNNIFNRIDSQLGLNTRPIRESIVKIYEGVPKAVTTKGIAGGVKEKVETEIRAGEEFKVGDIIDTQGRSNMVSPVTIREIIKNTLKFTDAEGTDFAGMARSTVRNLIKEGAWKKALPAKPKPKGQPLVRPKIKVLGKYDVSIPIEKQTTAVLEQRLTQRISAGENNLIKLELEKRVAEKKQVTQKEVVAKAVEEKPKEVAKVPTLKEAREAFAKTKKPEAIITDVTPEGFEPTVKEVKPEIPKGVSGAASIGTFAGDIPVELGSFDKIRPVEFPELVSLARDLTGGYVPTLRKFQKALGRFYGIERGRIKLSPDLFKAENSVQLASTLAHEVGHLIDYLPEETLKRGNLLGHLFSLRKFMKGTFGEVEISNSIIREELKAVSKMWRPYDESKVPQSYKSYRNSSKELYADALSVLLNTPGTLEKLAPTFYDTFFAELDRKPEFKEAYFNLQELLSKDRAELVKMRREGVQEMFKVGDTKAVDLQIERDAERQARQRNLWFRFKFDLVDTNQPLIEKVNALKKQGIYVNPDDNPVYFLEERNYLGGKIKAYFEEKFQPVYKNVTDLGVAWEEFGEALMYERILAGDRTELANPRGITPQVAQEMYDNLKIQLGEERFNQMKAEMDNFRQGIKDIATEAYEEGLYTDELYQKMQDNPAYATYQVLDHIEEGINSRVYKQIGTLKDITNPADASLLKTISTLRAIERNKVTRSIVNFLDQFYAGDIKDARMVFTGKGRVPVESKLPNEELITYYENGKLQGRYVDPYIKKSIDRGDIGQNNIILGSIKFMNSHAFRPLFITFNLGFQAFNTVRDFTRYWKNTPALSMGRALSSYKKAFLPSKIRAFGLPKNPTPEDLEAAKFIRSMEADQVLSVTYNDLILGKGTEDTQIEYIMDKVGVGGLKNLKPNNWIRRNVVRPLNFIKKTGDFIETLPKVAATYELTGKMPVKEMRSFVRRKVGSPDFLAGGYLKPYTNEVFLFSNAITQGIRSDIEIMVDPKTRSGFWFKTAKVTFFPKIVMFAALAGLFGEKIRKMMADASEYDRTNYIVIPIGEDENGKTLYLRIPQDETGRTIGGIFWKMLNLAKSDQSVFKSITDLLSFTGGQLPSLAPTIEGISAISQFLAGQNPYDFFRGRNVIPEEQYKAGGVEAAKPFIAWLFNQMGGGIFMKFNVGEYTPRQKSEWQKIIELPIISNLAGRFLRVSDYGEYESLMKQLNQLQGAEASERLKEDRIINNYIKKAQEDGAKEAELSGYTKDLVKEIMGEIPTDSEGVAKANRLIKKFKLSFVRGGADPKVNALLSATSNDQKIAMLKIFREGMSKDDFVVFEKYLVENKIVSANVINELNSQQ